MRAILMLLVVCIASASAQSLEDTLNKVVTDMIQKQITDQLPGLADQAIKAIVDKAPGIINSLTDKVPDLAKSIMDQIGNWFGKRDVQQLQDFVEKLQDAKKQLVAKLQDIYKKFIAKLVKSSNKREENDAVEEATNGFQDFFKQIGKHIQDILGEISKQGLGKVLDTLNPNKDAPKRDVVSIADLFKELEALVGEHFSETKDAISQKLQEVVDTLRPLIKDTKEQIARRDVVSIADLIKELEALIDEEESQTKGSVSQMLQEVVDELKGLIQDPSVAKRSALDDWIKSLLGGKTPQDAFAEIQKAVIEATVNHKDSVLAALQPKYEELKAKLGEHAQNAADSLLNNLKNAIGSFKDSIGKRGIFDDWFKNILGGKTPQDAFAEIQKAVIEATVNHKDSVLAALQPKYEELKAKLGEHAQTAADSLLNNLKNALGSMQDSIGKRQSDFWGDLAKNFLGKTPQEAFAEVQKAVIEAMIGHKDNVLAALQPKYEELKAKLSDHAQNAADSIMTNVKDALGSLADIVGKGK